MIPFRWQKSGKRVVCTEWVNHERIDVRINQPRHFRSIVYIIFHIPLIFLFCILSHLWNTHISITVAQCGKKWRFKIESNKANDDSSNADFNKNQTKDIFFFAAPQLPPPSSSSSSCVGVYTPVVCKAAMADVQHRLPSAQFARYILFYMIECKPWKERSMMKSERNLGERVVTGMYVGVPFSYYQVSGIITV